VAAGTWTPAATRGQIWLHNGTPNTPVFTDDAGGDNYIVTTTANLTDGYIPTWTSNVDDQAKLDNPGDLYYQSGSLRVQNASAELLLRERASISSSFAGYGHIWVRSDEPTNLVFRDDAATDHIVVKGPPTSTDFSVPTFNGTDGGLLRSTGLTFSSGKLALGANGNVNMDERAVAPGPSAGEGAFWVKNDAPNTAMFSDDASEDTYLTGAPRSLTLGAAATTFAITGRFMVITGDAGTNTIATITGAAAGQELILLFVDGNVTITDDNAHTADSVDLSASFTSADDTVLKLIYDGTSWYEISRSVN